MSWRPLFPSVESRDLATPNYQSTSPDLPLIFKDMDIPILALAVISVIFASFFVLSVYFDFSPIDRLLWFFSGRAKAERRITTQFALVKSSPETIEDGVSPSRLVSRFSSFLTLAGHDTLPRPPPAYTLPKRFQELRHPSSGFHNTPVIHIRPPSVSAQSDRSASAALSGHSHLTPNPQTHQDRAGHERSPRPMVGLGLGLQLPANLDSSPVTVDTQSLSFSLSPDLHSGLSPLVPKAQSTPFIERETESKSTPADLTGAVAPTIPLVAKVRRSWYQTIGFAPPSVPPPSRLGLYPVDSTGAPIPVDHYSPAPPNYAHLHSCSFPNNSGIPSPTTASASGSNRNAGGIRRLSARVSATSRALVENTKRILGIEAINARREAALEKKLNNAFRVSDDEKKHGVDGWNPVSIEDLSAWVRQLSEKGLMD